MPDVWEPLSRTDAMEAIGEGVHTGLRKGSEAPESMPLHRAIAASSTAWAEAIEFAVSGLASMGLELCRRVGESDA